MRCMGWATRVFIAPMSSAVAPLPCSIASVNGRRRFERELIEMQQDRLDASTRAVYDRDDHLPERVDLMQFWADKIDALRDDQSSVQLAVADRRA